MQPSRVDLEKFKRETYAFLERWTAPAGAGRAQFDIPGTCMKNCPLVMHVLGVSAYVNVAELTVL